MSNRIEYLILKTIAKQPTDYWHLLVASGVQYSLFLEALKRLLGSAIITHKDNLYSLTPKGEVLVEQTFLNRPLLNSKTIAQLAGIASNRPKRKDELDQALAPIEVILNRLDRFHAYGDLHQTRIVMLGDDDCMGAALALTEMPNEVIILEYDAELCDYYARYKLPNVTIRQHDLCHPIPDDIQGECDVFFTDPCPSLEMLKIFLSRGLECLRGLHCVGYTAMSQTEASLKKWHTLQKLLIDAGCAITELQPNTGTYDLEGDWLMQSGWNIVEHAPFPPPKPSMHWYCSALMRIETIWEPSPLIEGVIEWDLPLYKDHEVILTKEEEKAVLNKHLQFSLMEGSG